MTTPRASSPPQPERKPDYPTGKEMSRLLKLGLLTAMSGNLIACSQQQVLGVAPLPPPIKIIHVKGK